MRMGIGGTLALAILAAAPLRAQTAGVPEQPRHEIVTMGEGEVRIVPDRATIIIGVQSRAATAAAAAADNARRQRGVIDTLKALGVPANLISTVGYSVYPESRFDKDTQQNRIVAYVVNNNVRAELHRLDLVGPAIDAGLAKGANQVNSLQFTVSNADEVRRTALAQAVTNARADAEAIARAAGGRLGDLIQVTTMSAPRPMFEAFSGMRNMAAAAPAPTPVEPGEATVSANVTVRWEFIPAR